MAQKVILDLFVENSYHLYDITIGSARRQFVSYISLLLYAGFCSVILIIAFVCLIAFTINGAFLGPIYKLLIHASFCSLSLYFVWMTEQL